MRQLLINLGLRLVGVNLSDIEDIVRQVDEAIDALKADPPDVQRALELIEEPKAQIMGFLQERGVL